MHIRILYDCCHETITLFNRYTRGKQSKYPGGENEIDFYLVQPYRTRTNFQLKGPIIPVENKSKFREKKSHRCKANMHFLYF